MGKYLLGIDIGGGSVKCMLYATENKAVTVAAAKMPAKALFAIGEFGYGMDLNEMMLAVKDCASQCLQKGSIGAVDVAALSFSTLRHTLVALDAQGNVLFASPNRDARAVDQTMRLIDTCAEEIYQISGHRPMPNLTACKLQWLRDTRPDVYEKIATAFTVEDYFNFKLTGVIKAERSNAGETMLYDLGSNRWSDELIDKLALKRTMFPELVDSGVVLGKITQQAAAEFGLNAETVVVTGAGDTQSALLGMGVLNAGETGVSAGTTAPIQMLVDRPCIDPKGRSWAGASALPGKYVAECNGGGMGIALEWIAGLLFGDTPKPVASLMAAAAKTGAGAGGAVSTIGAQIFNHSVLSLPIDQMMFSTTNYTPNASDRGKVSRAVLEGMALAVRANVEQLSEITGLKPARLHISGGISQAAVFNEIVSDALSLPVVNPKHPEASAFGAVICAAMALGGYATLDEASKALCENRPAVNSCGESYERIYEEWKEMYASTFEATMPLGALINELRSDAKGETGETAEPETLQLRIYTDADLSDDSVRMLREFGTVTHKNYRDGDMLEGDDMVATLKDYDVFITEVDIVDAAIIKQLPNLRMIGVCRGNPTNVDVEACSSAGIPVVYTPGRNADGVADLTLAFILSAARMIPQASAFLKEEGAAGDMGRMGAAYFRYQGTELWHQTVGIIGGGAIGKKVAKRLLGFETDLLVYDPYLSDSDATLMGAQKVELDELLAQSAIITIHAPVTDETTGMIGREQFAKMKNGALFVNTARAALVDYAALLEALQSGKLAGAALDVFPVEPPASDDPLVLKENVITTPHIAGNTKQVSIHQGIIMAENIEKLLRGEMGSDVINRKDIKHFSFSGEKVIDEAALERLSANVLGVNDLDTSKQETEQPKARPSTPAVVPAAAPSAVADGAGGYTQYMALIREFLKNLSTDEEVKAKTSGKDISFQITFKDNEESCYMYFNKGDIDANLGVFPKGSAEVNLRMPIEIFDGMMRGTVNGANAAMTGKMSFTGNVRKAMSMQSILKLMMSSYEKALQTVGDVDVSRLTQGAAPAAAPSAASPAPVSAASVKTSGGTAGYAKYMALVKEFLRVMSNDEEVKAKTAGKEISFQITFKDNEESCYIIFNKGVIDAGLGLIEGGQAEVNLRMPMEIFDGMMKGSINGANAAMTGKMSFTGNVRKAMSMQSILKLMMGAYEQAIKVVGEVDVTSLGAEEPAQSAPGDAGIPVSAGAPALPMEPSKQGFFGKLFGKKAQTAPAQDVQTCAPQVIVAGPPEKPKTNDVRDDILQITNELYEKGLLTGIGGNISARCEDNPNHVWITPSSVFKGDLRADMMVRVDLEGNNVGSSDLSASSEKMVHLAIYKRRPEIMSVIHSHAPKATLMALTNLKFLPISTDAAFIGDIPVVPFVIPGSPELGEMVGEAIGENGSAVIMQNHGLVVAGASCRRAADNTEVVELTAEKLIECHMMGVEPVLLPKEAQEELAELGKMLV